MKINDPFLEFSELSGAFNVISKSLKLICQNDKLNLEENTIVSD